MKGWTIVSYFFCCLSPLNIAFTVLHSTVDCTSLCYPVPIPCHAPKKNITWWKNIKLRFGCCVYFFCSGNLLRGLVVANTSTTGQQMRGIVNGKMSCHLSMNVPRCLMMLIRLNIHWGSIDWGWTDERIRQYLLLAVASYLPGTKLQFAKGFTGQKDICHQMFKFNFQRLQCCY